jgi:cell division GTPase FtsZ
MSRASEGIRKLRENVNAILVVDNQKVLSIGEANIPWMTRLRKIDDFVGGILSGFVNVTRDNSKMKLDFNDIKLMFQNCEGSMFIGAGEANYAPMSADNRDWDGGKKAMMEAVENAISSPLVDGIDLKNAKGVIALYLMGEDVSMEAIDEAQERVMDAIGNDEANIIVGADSNESLNGKIKVFFILAGLSEQEEEEKKQASVLSFKTTIFEPGVKINMFEETDDEIKTISDGPTRIIPEIISEKNRIGCSEERNVFPKGNFVETETIESKPETPKQNESRILDFKTGGSIHGFPNSRTNVNNESQQTPSIHGFEPIPGYMRTQCQ